MFSRVASLIEQLDLIKYSKCQGMDELLSNKVKLIQQLKYINCEIKDGVLAALILDIPKLCKRKANSQHF